MTSLVSEASFVTSLDGIKFLSGLAHMFEASFEASFGAIATKNYWKKLHDLKLKKASNSKCILYLFCFKELLIRNLKN